MRAFGTKAIGHLQEKQGGHFTLHRFLGIYLAFCLILFCLLAPVYIYTERTIHQAELERCRTRLETGVETLESALEGLYNLSLSTYADSRFQTLLRTKDISKIGVLTLKEMHKIVAGGMVHNSLFEDAGLLVGKDVAFTRQRLFFANPYYSMYPDYLQCEEMTFDAWFSMMKEHHGQFLPSMQYTANKVMNFSAIAFSLRWPSDYNSSNSFLYAIIRADQLMRLMADEDVLTLGHLIFRDASGNILAQTDDKVGEEPFTELSVVLTAGRGSMTVKVPERVLGMRLQSMNKLILTYVVCVVAVALLAVLFFAYQSAKPMRKLLSELEGTNSSVAPPKEEKLPRLQQDYQFLAQNIRSMGNQLEIYRRTVETQRQILCAGIWERSLVHGLHSQGEVEKFRSLFPDFPSFWRLGVVRYSVAEHYSIEESAALQVRLCAQLSRIAPGAMAENAETGVAAVLLPGNYQVDPDGWQAHFAQLEDDLQIIACALSDAYETVEALHAAYQQALDLSFLPGEMPFVREMKDMPKESFRVPLSILDAEMLYNALRSGNLDVAQHILAGCLQEMGQDEENVMLWRFVYGQVANTVARLRMENPSELLHMIIPRYDHAERKNLFHAELPACFRQICESRSSNAENEIQRIERVLQYIDEHLMDSQLGVAALVNEFRQSAPTLQKNIRSKTGMTLAAYIDERRLALAVRMLTETDLSISEISNRCGYSSVNSFYKAFKRRHGVAPSAMQRANKEENSEENS